MRQMTSSVRAREFSFNPNQQPYERLLFEKRWGFFLRWELREDGAWLSALGGSHRAQGNTNKDLSGQSTGNGTAGVAPYARCIPWCKLQVILAFRKNRAYSQSSLGGSPLTRIPEYKEHLIWDEKPTPGLVSLKSPLRISIEFCFHFYKDS